MRRNTEAWDTACGLLTLVIIVTLGAGLFVYLSAHPVIGALWALGATAGTLWLGALWVARTHDDRMRALSDTEMKRRAAERADTPPAVADVLRSCRTGRRIGDAERDVVVNALHAHFTAGRLDAAELNERVAGALAARTVEDLAETVDSLPDEVTGR